VTVRRPSPFGARSRHSWRTHRLLLASATLAGLVLLYLLAAWHLGSKRWDGLAPTAYRYVNSPPGYTNPGPPASAKQTVVFSNGVSQSVQVYTPDLQAQLVVPTGAFPPSSGGVSVLVTITPQAPPSVAGLVIDGNAYVVQATYTDGSPIPPPWKQPVLVYLLFPSGNLPAGLYTVKGSAATEVSKTVDFPSQTVQGQIDGPGTVAAAGPPRAGAGRSAAGGRSTTIAIIVVGVGVVLVALGLVFVARRRAGGVPDEGEPAGDDDRQDDPPPL
jgi:hypothetical protein